jgi:hypothetical protein
MSLAAEIVAEVRRRAGFACEFCGVSETDSGGALTLDHFRPVSRGGSDDIDNLIYCCARCNAYKQAYWPEETTALSLWNPRQEPAGTHFLELEDGRLLPLTDVAAFTVTRLRLNRAPLVSYRLNKRTRETERLLLRRYQELAETLEQLNRQLDDQMQAQRELLREQNELLRRFFFRD